jgi:N-acyl-D-amino-acid deacylase
MRRWRTWLEMESALRLYRGRELIGRTWTQVHSCEVNTILSFETTAPFDNWDVWKDFPKLPLDEQLGKLKSDAALKHKLIDIADRPYDGPETVGAQARPSDWDMFHRMDKSRLPHPSIAEIGKERGIPPAAAIIDVATEENSEGLLPSALGKRRSGQCLCVDETSAFHGDVSGFMVIESCRE